MDTIKTRLDWLNALSLTHSSDTTQRAYRWEIAELERSTGQAAETLTAQNVLAYVAGRRERVSSATVKRTVNALRSFYAFLGSDAADLLKLPAPKFKRQRSLTSEQAFAVLLACNTRTPLGRRNLALQALMLDSGLRESEVCRLEISKTDLEKRVLYVVVKGGQEMFGSFSVETSNYLSAWLADRASIATCPNVFVSMYQGEALTPDGLRTIFRYIGQAAGLDAYSPHDLRRTFATLATLLGSPSRVRQEAGRWHNLELVERYTQSITAQAMEKYSPVSGIMRGTTG
jgi:site-specific recombinase XerD